jgi:hypothetical protein
MQVLTSLSGLPLSAASAGFAPTNSADVSAIASAYQVVSGTGTQLYAGSSYVTSVNDAPISASRAGQAANASLSNSAYYDGTGRLISALPDSAAVSAIASSYAESAASSKQDTLEFGYDDGKISSIDGSALAGGGGGGGGVVTSIESAIDPWFRTGISGLNGSALYPKWAESARSAGYAAAAESASTAYYAKSAPTAWASSFITGVASPSGTIRVQGGGTAIECTNSAVLPSTVIEGFSIENVIAETTNTTSITVPVSNPTTRVHFGDAYGAPGTFAIDTDNGLHFESSIESYFDVTFDLPNATSFTATYPWVANLRYTASATYKEEGGGVAELAWASALPTYEYDGSGKISAIDGSALAGGGGGVDSATVSAIASSYVESGVSSKQDASAMSSYALSSDVSGTVDLVSSQSANWGGSALQLSAGPGVTFTKSGNVLVAGLDETVLWSGEGISAGQSTSLSESITAFERIRVYGHTHNGKAFSWTNEQEALSSQIYGVGLGVWQGSNQELDFSRYSVSGNSISALSGSFIANLNPIGMGNTISWVYKVVGIGRTAEA